MKTNFTIILPLIAALAVPYVRAQAEPTQSEPERKPEHKEAEGKEGRNRQAREPWKRQKEGEEKFRDLTEQERARIRKAVAAAWADASVKEARKKALDAAREYKKALRDAVLAADPELGDLLDQIERMFGNPQGFPDRPKFEGKLESLRLLGMNIKAFEALDEPTRAEMRKAFEETMAQPEVAAARKAIEESEDKRAAFQSLRRLVREAMKRSHPAIAEKIDALIPEHNTPPDQSGLREEGKPSDPK